MPRFVPEAGDGVSVPVPLSRSDLRVPSRAFQSCRGSLLPLVKKDPHHQQIFRPQRGSRPPASAGRITTCVPSQSRCPIPGPVSRPSPGVPSESRRPVPVPASRPSPGVPSTGQSLSAPKLTSLEYCRRGSEHIRDWQRRGVCAIPVPGAPRPVRECRFAI
jgi:hypothetical protein